MTLELLHFGDHCMPGIIINDTLKIQKKGLFQLGHYFFNDIINFLYDNKYHDIYDEQYLVINTRV